MQKLDDKVVAAISAALRDPTVFEGVDLYLTNRKADLERKLNLAARSALYNDGAKAAALVLEGHLAEIEALISIINRWKE